MNRALELTYHRPGRICCATFPQFEGSSHPATPPRSNLSPARSTAARRHRALTARGPRRGIARRHQAFARWGGSRAPCARDSGLPHLGPAPAACVFTTARSARCAVRPGLPGFSRMRQGRGLREVGRARAGSTGAWPLASLRRWRGLAAASSGPSHAASSGGSGAGGGRRPVGRGSTTAL